MLSLRRPRLATWATLTALLALALVLSAVRPASAAPGRIVNAGAPGAVAGSYLVVYRSSKGPAAADATTARLAAAHRATVTFRYHAAISGFAARMSAAQAREVVVNPAVAYVEQDRTTRASDVQTPTPSWGLDRIDQRGLPGDRSYHYPATAKDVTAYVLDTGIRITHTDFGGRARWGLNAMGDGTDTDCNGHGTHVAGTVGGSRYGVAKQVALVAVKVLGCNGSGTISAAVAGVDWVTAQHTSGPAVANMSLGAPGSSQSMENAVRAAVADGVTFAVAAGNSSEDACDYTPSRTPEAITVTASTEQDQAAWFTNYGSCTDLYAPGDGISSDFNTSDDATEVLSGTSMASPHVAGAAALALAVQPNLSPAQVGDLLQANATPDLITDDRSKNLLLFVPTTTRRSAPYEIAYRAASGHLGQVGHESARDLGLSVRADTSPSIAELSTGRGHQIAYQATDGKLHTTGPAGTKNWGLGMMAGTSPSITALPAGGYQVAFQANTGNLYTVGDGPGSTPQRNWRLGLLIGTSPSITALPAGGYQVAFQANTGSLYSTGTAYGESSRRNWRLAVRAGTSPAIAGLGDGDVRLAYQANDGTLVTVGQGPDAAPRYDWGLPLAAGTSPAITARYEGGVQLAVHGANGSLWTAEDSPAARESLNLGQTLDDTVSPSIAREAIFGGAGQNR